jgi:hypothetical protein
MKAKAPVFSFVAISVLQPPAGASEGEIIVKSLAQDLACSSRPGSDPMLESPSGGGAHTRFENDLAAADR